MENKTLEVIAERELSLKLDDGSIKTVIVKIGKPQPVAGSDVFRCHFQFLGLHNDRIRYAEGADTMQALILALTKIGSQLYTLPEFRSMRLTSLGERNLGFPLFVMENQSVEVPDPIGLLQL
ncbi:DUF6968 family protein [Massilia pseudoviolaceinigra]|uniref:DUF6968 family protein n=1 Tax=Massilia pseudoviolaceinigra TaxID=3057165 RepID=UPI0027967D8F|nr:hypothetical protein [Massilia sp. CCM 9206]MDQ1925108.1 hypothetical protein [Massilia sp. CCM 9206]